MAEEPAATATATAAATTTLTAQLQGIFAGVFFAIVPTPVLSSEQEQEIIQELTRHGATHRPLSSDLSDLSHIISDTSDFPAYTDAVDGFLHVVKPSWVTQSILRGKAANTRQFSPDPNLFLSDVTVTFANDIPEGDRDAIVGGLLAMGGQYSQPVTKAVTHVIALSLDNHTCEVVRTKNLSCTIVLPHWFDDCLKLGRRIDTAPYALPNPRILRPEAEVQILSSQDIEDTQSITQDGPPPPPLRKRDVFRGHVFRLDPDLALSTHLRESLTAVIAAGGGSVVNSPKDAEILVCKYRTGQAYKTALKENKEIGSLQWLYFLINNDRWISPLRRLLHYPIPKNGISGFQKAEICVSNYTGMARSYLENLIKAAGGTFTKTLSQNNTHLITAHTLSEKCDAAREWGIEIVNHLWLEESYAKCRLQTLSNPQYTTFPSKTNLTQVLGQTPIDREKVREFFGPALAAQSAHKEKPEATVKTGANSVEDAVGAESTSDGAAFTPSKRGAKDRALSKLHKMAPDIALFEKEMKRVGGVIHGGRRVKDPDRINLEPRSNAKRSREQSDADRSDEDEDEDEDEVPPKKAKNTGKFVRVFATGGKDACDVSKLHKIDGIGDIKVFSDESKLSYGVDVLIAHRMLRTVKFLTAISLGADVVREEWVDNVLASRGKDVSTRGFELKDSAFEKNEKVVLAESLERARRYRKDGGLLHGWTLFCTPTLNGSTASWKPIIEALGGKAIEFKGRATKAPPFTRRRMAQCEKSAGSMDTEDLFFDEEPVDVDDDLPRRLFLLSGEDRSQWAKFRDVAEAGGYKPCIVKTEWLLRVALTQSLDEWSDSYEWDP